MTRETSRWVRVLPAAGFLGVLAIHAGWRLAHLASASVWADLASYQSGPAHTYVASGDVLLGISYGAATALALYGISRTALNRRAGVAGAVGGLSLGGLLAVAGCFLVGCCGSPMLAVWASLFGTRALGGGKFVTAGLTLASVAGGWWWLNRCCRRNCCGEDCK